MEKLHELVEDGGFDVVVVDTPPSRNARIGYNASDPAPQTFTAAQRHKQIGCQVAMEKLGLTYTGQVTGLQKCPDSTNGFIITYEQQNPNNWIKFSEVVSCAVLILRRRLFDTHCLEMRKELRLKKINRRNSSGLRTCTICGHGEHHEIECPSIYNWQAEQLTPKVIGSDEGE